MDAHDTTATPARRRLDRRTVLKGAAWSVPAVVAVGATPAYANSVLVPLVALSPMVVSRSHNSGTYAWSVRNDDTEPVVISSMAVSGVTTGFTISYPTPPPTIAAGTTVEITFTVSAGITANNDTMPAFDFTVNYREDDGFPTGSGFWQVSGGAVGNSKSENWTLSGITYSDPNSTAPAQADAELAAETDQTSTVGAPGDPEVDGVQESPTSEPENLSEPLPGDPELDPSVTD